MKRYSTTQFISFSFIKGMGSVIDLTGVMRKSYFEFLEVTNEQSLMSDWQEIGNDMRSAFKVYSKDLEDECRRQRLSIDSELAKNLRRELDSYESILKEREETVQRMLDDRKKLMNI